MKGLTVASLTLDHTFSSEVVELHNVRLDGCPLDTVTNEECIASTVTEIYNGPANLIYDNGLDPFTGN